MNLIKEIERKLQSTKSEVAADRLRTKLAELKQYEQEVFVKSEINSLLEGVAVPDGGATFNLDGQVPTVGFCASPFPQFSKVINSAEELTFDVLASFVADVTAVDSEIFSADNTFLGLWNDPETGKIYLDVSQHFMSAEKAREICLQHDQIAFFDLNVMESVDVDRNALSGQI